MHAKKVHVHNTPFYHHAPESGQTPFEQFPWTVSLKKKPGGTACQAGGTGGGAGGGGGGGLGGEGGGRDC